MPVSQAVQTMSEQDIGSLVIMELGTLTGMLVPRDHPPHARAWRHAGRHHHPRHHGRRPVSVSPNTSADEVQRLMLEKHALHPRHGRPDADGRDLFYDMAQAIVAAQKFENNMLKAYIRDWPLEGAEDKTHPEALRASPQGRRYGPAKPAPCGPGEAW